MTPIRFPLASPQRALAIALSIFALAGCTGDTPEALLSKAQSALAKEERKTAEIHLKNLLQADPQNRQGRMMLAELHVFARDDRSAAKEWQRALDAGADADVVVPKLLASLHGSSRFTEVHAVADRYPLKTESAQAQALYWRGQALWQERKADQARRLFQEALVLQADHHPSRLALIRMQVYQDPVQARNALDALLEKAPAMADALLLRAEFAVSERNLTLAQELLRKAIAADPRHLQSRVRLITLLAEQRDYKSAEAEYSNLATSAKQAVLTRMMRALLDHRQGRLQQASDGMESVLKGAMDYPPALILATQIALARGEVEKADQYAKRVAELTEQSIPSLRLQAAVALARNEPERALQIARSRIDRGQEDPGLLALAGEASLRRNDFAGAIDLLARATRVDPKDASMRTALGVASLAAGNARAGFTELEQAVALDADSTRADLVLIGQRLQRGEWDAALAAIDRLEQKQPGRALTVNLRGAALLAKGESKAARKSFEEALAREGGFFPAVANLVRLDLNEAKSADALQRLEAFVKAQPRDVNGLLALAQLINAQGAKSEDVTRLLRRAHEAAPTQVDALIALATQLMLDNKATEALPLVQKAVAQNPEDLRLLDLLGTLHLRNKDQQQALEVFARIVRIKPDLAAAHQRLGEVRSAAGDQNGALASFKRAAELDTKNYGARFGMAGALIKDGRKEEALLLARKLQQEQPRSAVGYILEGDLLLANSQPKDAVAAYRRSLTIERSAMGALREFQTLVQIGDLEQADAALKASIAASPDDLVLRSYAGQRALETKQWKIAGEHFERIVKRNPTSVEGQNNLAWALHMQNDPRAETHARAAFQIAPLSGQVADTLGIILLTKGQVDQALDLLRQAALLTPRNPDIRIHLLQALHRAGRQDELRAQSDSWIRDFPGSPRVDEVQALQKRTAGG